MYMPNKPCEYGRKMMAVTVAMKTYLYKIYIYCGKDCGGNQLTQNTENFLNKRNLFYSLLNLSLKVIEMSHQIIGSFPYNYRSDLFKAW